LPGFAADAIDGVLFGALAAGVVGFGSGLAPVSATP
jgi:hypothetical protein